MNKTIPFFKESHLCKELAQLINANYQKIDCQKIVVFGGFSLGLSTAPLDGQGQPVWVDDYPMRVQIQHAAVLAIRDSLSSHYNRNIPIYLRTRATPRETRSPPRLCDDGR